jgi:signal transduction histidine kinase
VAGELSQVFLNLIINAADAIGDAIQDGAPQTGTIWITSRRDGDFAEVRVRDSGTGIPPAVRPRIFDPFFTTKDVGQGSGQGLAISYAIVVQKHRGTIEFETTVGVGTTFIIRLPLRRPEECEPIALDSCGVTGHERHI